MRLVFHDGLTKVETLIGLRSIRNAGAAIVDLQQSCGQSGDLMASLHRIDQWCSIHTNLPAALLLRRQGRLYAVVWLSYRRIRGAIVGLVTSGNLCGQGSVIARQEDRRDALEVAARILLRKPLAHTVVLSTLWDGTEAGAAGAVVSGVRGGWQFRDVRFRLDLSGGAEALMQRLGYKMRRNLRYYRRRAEMDLGCRFVPEMTAEQRQQAVAALFDKGTYPIGQLGARKTEAALLTMPGRFAMGLQDQDGAWVSYVAGWRGQNGTHVDWQLNHDGYQGTSLSTAMRAYLLEHEAGRGSPCIVFVNLTSDFWSRVCEPAICGDLVATRADVVGGVAHWFASRINPSGKIANLHARPGGPLRRVGGLGGI